MGRVPRTPRDSIILQEITSKNLREFYHWMTQVSQKLEGTDTTLADEEKKSISPLIGITQDLGRKLEHLEHENRSLRASIADLLKRVKHLEGEI